MNHVIQSLREKTDQFVFSGYARFDKHEVQEIGNMLRDAHDLTNSITDNIENIQGCDIDITNLTVSALSQIADAKKLAELNDMPEHFTEIFVEMLDKIRDDVMEIKANEIGKYAGEIASEIFSKGIEI